MLPVIGFTGGVISGQALKPSDHIVKPVSYTATHASEPRTATIEPVLLSCGISFTRYLAILSLCQKRGISSDDFLKKFV
jgi:hypothetical protein